VVVVGAGQAGLSVAACLQQRGIRPLLLEKHRVAYAWDQQRWDSFCLVTPNWQCRLPGFPYRGDDPHGFMAKEAVVRYLRAYATTIGAEVQEGVEVQRLRPAEGAFQLATSGGDLRAGQVVVATGGYHTPRRPPLAERLPQGLLQIDAFAYRNPEQLPPGPVLVVGSGQSGCQIAEDLFLAGRRVHLSVGRAPRSPRRYRGRDVVEWLERMGHYATPIDQQDDPVATRAKTNHVLTGRDGGREIDLRQRAREGMALHGRLRELEGSRFHFDDDLAANLDQADAAHARIRAGIDAFIAQQGLESPEESPSTPCWQPPPGNEPIDLEREPLAALIWATGYSTDLGWIEADVFEGNGFPRHHRGITPQPGLYFLGLPWLHTWGSGRFGGVGADAEFLAETITGLLQGRGVELAGVEGAEELVVKG
jgi:putative flavoprotein involved in K+ transport